jgi:acyl carrier protein
MILAFEEEFGVSFPDNEVVELLSLEAILAALDKKLQSR